MPTALSVGAGGVVWTFFSHLSFVFFLILSLGNGPIQTEMLSQRAVKSKPVSVLLVQCCNRSLVFYFFDVFAQICLKHVFYISFYLWLYFRTSPVFYACTFDGLIFCFSYESVSFSCVSFRRSASFECSVANLFTTTETNVFLVL